MIFPAQHESDTIGKLNKALPHAADEFPINFEISQCCEIPVQVRAENGTLNFSILFSASIFLKKIHQQKNLNSLFVLSNRLDACVWFFWLTSGHFLSARKKQIWILWNCADCTFRTLLMLNIAVFCTITYFYFEISKCNEVWCPTRW